jgi:hypothetical protein
MACFMLGYLNEGEQIATIDAEAVVHRQKD